ncbi:MAG: chitin disaccharide deacetylase [Negativicutes bacterium]|nr:chitin disaccharide deacetylase [Negativicutes bacterium]
MQRLIINADDLGLTPGCNAGIVRGLTQGIVSDTTLMVNTDYTQAAVNLLKEHGISQAGLHLNLTFGVPLSPLAEVPSLVDENGRFFRKIARSVGGLKPQEVEKELRAQVARFGETGLHMTHLDSHHHAHIYPGIFAMVLSLAKELAVPLRQTSTALREKITSAGVATTDAFSLDFYDKGVTLENLQQIIRDHTGEVLEIMCHPAEAGELIYTISDYNSRREEELAILTSAAMKAFLRENDITLISFAEL